MTRRFPSGSPITSSWATAPARSWPCPAHDERDLEFARQFDLPVIPVVQIPGRRRRNPSAVWTMAWRLIPRSSTACRRRRRSGRLSPGWKKKGRRSRHSLQAARLAFFATALLGRAISDRLARTASRSPARERTSPHAAGVGGLQTDRHRRTAAGQGERMAPLFRRGGARDEHDAAMGRLVLVLPEVLRSAKRRAFRRRGGGTILDGRGQ